MSITSEIITHKKLIGEAEDGRLIRFSRSNDIELLIQDRNSHCEMRIYFRDNAKTRLLVRSIMRRLSRKEIPNA